MVDYRIGIEIVALDRMKCRFSYRDLLLFLGIAVAVIIALMTVIYRDNLPEATKTTPVPQKSSLNSAPAVVIHKFLKKVDLTSSLR